MPFITRKAYLDQQVSHDQYYSQFVTPAIREAVANRFPVELLRSAGEHLNGIELAHWDNLGERFHPLISKMLRSAGDFLSLAGVVCILKQAALEIIRDADSAETTSGRSETFDRH